MLRLAFLSVLFALTTSNELLGSEPLDEASHRRVFSTVNVFDGGGTATIDDGTSSSVKAWKLRLTNLAFGQPLSPTFVIVHNASATALFTLGGIASPGLKLIAEKGSSDTLLTEYLNAPGVKIAEVMGTEPIAAGESREFTLEADINYPFISLAMMAVNTNDCFVGFNNIKPEEGKLVFSPGYDAGTEDNDEKCNHIPGPACIQAVQTDDAGAGEGYVHVHPGVRGIAELDAFEYDWRNPMLQVKITKEV